jgi:RND family efflux transporter MFP subunit
MSNGIKRKFPARRTIIVSSIALGLASAGYVGWSMANGGAHGPRESAHAAEVRLVKTLTVEPKPDAARASAVGEIRPRRESDFGFRLSGKLNARTAEIGVAVKKGEVIARIDDQDYRNRVRSAKADQASAEAAVVEARAAEKRIRTLLEKGFTTRANHESTVKNLRSTEAKLEAMNAALDMANDQLAYTELRADFDGIVTSVGAEAGQVVNIGQMIARIADPAEKDAVFSIAEASFDSEAPAQPIPPITVSLLSNPAVTTQGLIREVSPIADGATRTYQVKVGLKDAPEAMRFGASVAGRVQTDVKPVVVVPGSALFDTNGQPAVWLVGADAKVVLKPIIVARYETDRIVVESGLVKGDIVVTAGVNRLRDGETVRIEGEMK